MFRIFVAWILAPLLAAAPPSVEKLLKKPHPGDIAVELNNGEKREGWLATVNNEFLAIRQPTGCYMAPI